jgi:Domain of unknown function (DUF4340)
VVEETMNSRGLTIAVVVLAALTGVLYWSEHRKAPEENAAVPASSAPVIFKIDPSNVTQLVIKQKQSDPVTLEKAGETWQITAPKPYPADQNAVATLISTLSALNADRLVADKGGNSPQYGLQAPAVELDITDKGHTTQLLLGDDTPAGSDAYAALAADPRVFTVASYNKSSLSKNLNDLRDKSLITLNADKVSRVELLKKGQDIEFDRTKDGWQILKPKASPAETSAVNDLVRTLTDAKMDLSATGNASAEFAHATGVGTAKLTGDSGVQTLEVRKNKDAYYAKSSATEGAYKVDSTLGQAMDKKLDDFISKKKT